MQNDGPKTMGMPLDPEAAFQDTQMNEAFRNRTLGDDISATEDLISQVRAQNQKIIDTLRNPIPLQMYEAPEDAQINPLAAIGAGLRAIGGDTKSLDSLLARKSAIADEQRKVSMMNAELANRQALAQNSNLIDALQIELDQKKWEHDVRSKAMEDVGSISTPEDALEWLNTSARIGLYGTAADMLASPAGRKAASMAYGTNDQNELMRRLNTGLFAPRQGEELSQSQFSVAREPFKQLIDGYEWVEEFVPNDPDRPERGGVQKQVAKPMSQELWEQLYREAMGNMESLPPGSRLRAILEDDLRFAIEKRNRLLGQDEGGGGVDLGGGDDTDLETVLGAILEPGSGSEQYNKQLFRGLYEGGDLPPETIHPLAGMFSGPARSSSVDNPPSWLRAQ